MTRFRPRRFAGTFPGALGACVLAFAALATSRPASAGDLSPPVAAVRDRWAVVNYDLPKPQREAAFEALSRQAAAARTAQPKDAGALIWEGIVLSSYAGERGGLGALKLAKAAKADFEQAIRLAPGALDGSAYVSLAVLYHQVPGWPLGFGDDDKAQDLFNHGLQASPDGIDANYFYGQYLLDKGDWKRAATALQKAIDAPARPGRERADQGRRREAAALLARARDKLAAR